MKKLKRHFLLHRRFWSAILAIGVVAALVGMGAFFIWLSKVNAAILMAIPVFFIGAFMAYGFYIIGDAIYEDIRSEMKWGRWRD